MTTNSELSSIFADLTARYSIPPIGPGEFTIQMFAKDRGVTYNQAEAVIGRALMAGALVEVGERRVGRHNARAFRMVA